MYSATISFRSVRSPAAVGWLPCGSVAPGDELAIYVIAQGDLVGADGASILLNS